MAIRIDRAILAILSRISEPAATRSPIVLFRKKHAWASSDTMILGAKVKRGEFTAGDNVAARLSELESALPFPGEYTIDLDPKNHEQAIAQQIRDGGIWTGQLSLLGDTSEKSWANYEGTVIAIKALKRVTAFSIKAHDLLMAAALMAHNAEPDAMVTVYVPNPTQPVLFYRPSETDGERLALIVQSAPQPGHEPEFWKLVVTEGDEQ
jgi:hypothetical protein